MSAEGTDAKDAKISRCQQMVGEYLWRWALMESQLNGAICGVLGIKGKQQAILCGKIQFRQKLDILAECLLDYRNQKYIDRMCSKLNGLHDNRNILAHEFFVPGESRDEVVFIKWPKKRGTWLIEEAWSAEKFRSQYVLIDYMIEELRQLSQELSDRSRV